MSEDGRPRVELDCRGLPCPRPVIELAAHLGDVAVGDLLAVLATDPAARYDVPAWCRMGGQGYVGSEPVPGPGAEVTRYLVRRLV